MHHLLGQGNIGDVPVEKEEDIARTKQYEASIEGKVYAAEANLPHSGGRGGKCLSSSIIYIFSTVST